MENGLNHILQALPKSQQHKDIKMSSTQTSLYHDTDQSSSVPD